MVISKTFLVSLMALSGGENHVYNQVNTCVLSSDNLFFFSFSKGILVFSYIKVSVASEFSTSMQNVST